MSCDASDVNDLGRSQGRPRQVLFGGGGTDSWAVGAQTHLPPKFSFSSDFGLFISKMLKNAKFANVSRKKIPRYYIFWGDVLR